LGEVLVGGIGDDALGLVTECELGVTEEGVVGGSNEFAGHLQNGVSASGGDACGEFLGFGFEFGRQRLGHDDRVPE
jgi:hypothetical protein